MIEIQYLTKENTNRVTNLLDTLELYLGSDFEIKDYCAEDNLLTADFEGWGTQFDLEFDFSEKEPLLCVGFERGDTTEITGESLWREVAIEMSRGT